MTLISHYTLPLFSVCKHQIQPSVVRKHATQLFNRPQQVYYMAICILVAPLIETGFPLAQMNVNNLPQSLYVEHPTFKYHASSSIMQVFLIRWKDNNMNVTNVTHHQHSDVSGYFFSHPYAPHGEVRWCSERDVACKGKQQGIQIRAAKPTMIADVLDFNTWYVSIILLL